MGFRLGFGGGCAPCCGGTTPPQPPITDCLVSCRPSGETRPISSINVRIQASDYEISFPGVGPSGPYTFHYKWPGSTYNSTFFLTPTATAGIYEYIFPKCGGCTPWIRYDMTNGACMLSYHLPGLVDYKTPTCSSLAVDIKDVGYNVTMCGDISRHNILAAYASWVLPHSFFNSVETQVANYIAQPADVANHVIFKTCSGTGGNYAGDAGLHVAAGTTGVDTYAITAPATIVSGGGLARVSIQSVFYGP